MLTGSDAGAGVAGRVSTRVAKKCSAVFSATMGALASCGRPAEAAALWADFLAAEFGPPPTFLSNELLRALGAKKGGASDSSELMGLDARADLALAVLASMRRSCNSGGYSNNNIGNTTSTTIPSNIFPSSSVPGGGSTSAKAAGAGCPDAFTYANALSALAEAGRWQQAVAVLQAVPPSIYVSSSSSSGGGVYGKQQQQQQFITACVVACGNAIPPRADVALALVSLGSPDVVAYSAALTCFDRAGDWAGRSAAELASS
jgi:hypothetical protein